MKYLTLVRHAKSSWNDPGLPDHERPLNDRGQRNAPDIARFLARTYFGIDGPPPLLPAPDHLITSSAVRTRQTAALMLDQMNLPPSAMLIEPRAYLASAYTLLEIIRGFDDSWQNIMLFAHNNGISELANFLLKRGSIGEMPTCATALLEFPVDFWANVNARQARLVGYITPKLLEKRFPSSELPDPFTGN